MKKVVVLFALILLGSSLLAQDDLSGSWDTGEHNTVVKIFEKEGVYVGEIISSDKSAEAVGKQIIKDLKKDEGEWEGKLYAARKKKWVDAKMSREDETLKIKVKVGFMSKTIEWKKAKTETEGDEPETEDKESAKKD